MMLLGESLGILVLCNRLGGLPGLKLTLLNSLGRTQFRSTAAQHCRPDTLITCQVMRLEHHNTRGKCRGPFRIIVPTYMNCALLGCYAASSGNFLLMFRDNLSVPSSRVTLEDGTHRLSQNVGKYLPLFSE